MQSTELAKQSCEGYSILSRGHLGDRRRDIEDGIHAMLMSDSALYTDICGEGAASALKSIGWKYLKKSSSMVVVDPDGIPASVGWVCEATHGLNLSYATAIKDAGKGLAGVATAAAILDYYLNHAPSQEIRVCAQFEVGNIPSHRVAFRLGLTPDDVLSFDAKSRKGTRKFIGTSAPLEVVLERCYDILPKAYLDEVEASMPSEVVREYPCVLV